MSHLARISMVASSLAACLFAAANGVAAPLNSQLAWQESAEGAVESGRKALKRRPIYPWYDRERDRLRRVRLNPPVETETRPGDSTGQGSGSGSGWGSGSGSGSGSGQGSGSGAGSGRSRPSSSPPPTRPPQTAVSSALGGVFQVIAYVILILVGIALVVGLIWVIVKAIRDRQPKPKKSGDKTDDDQEPEESLENLPFQLKRPINDLLAEAQRQYEQGNFREAIIYYYSYLLVELDRRNCIRLARGKTNRQYLFEIRSQRPLHGILEQTMVAFEDVFFGDHELERARFESCWARRDDFRSTLEQTSA